MKTYSLTAIFLLFLSSLLFAHKPDAPMFDNPRPSTILFSPNQGQLADESGNLQSSVAFSADYSGLLVWFSKDKISYFWTENIQKAGPLSDTMGIAYPSIDSIRRYRLDVRLVGANPLVSLEGTDKTSFHSNYYLGHCPNGITRVPSFERLVYREVYPGIDLIFYAVAGKMKYDFVVHPGGNPSDIRLQYDGSTKMEKQADGSVKISHPFGDLLELAPFSFQKDQRQVVESAFRIEGNTLSYQLGSYDPTCDLVIDPTVVWGTYFGGPGFDIATATFADQQGNSYLLGYTSSTSGMSSVGAHQTTIAGGEDAFLVSFDAAGGRNWATYYGGVNNDRAYGGDANAMGHIYLAGHTRSTTAIAFAGAQNTFGGSEDAFLVRFDQQGNRVWGTYLGGGTIDRGGDVGLDPWGNVFLLGEANSSTGIATPGAHQTSSAGGRDFMLAKYDSTGVKLWGTYFGGNSNDGNNDSNSADCDPFGNVVIGGVTTSTSGLATAGAHQTSNGGLFDACVAKFDSAGNLAWATFYGGPQSEQGYGPACDGFGNVFLVGSTFDTQNIATPGAHQSTHGGGRDAFLVKFDPNGVRQWATYYGGSGTDYIFGLDGDANGNVAVSGRTNSPNNIAFNGHFNTSLGSLDGWVAHFDSNGTRNWGTYWTTPTSEGGTDAYIDVFGNTYGAGFSSWPTGLGINGYQNSNAGSTDGYLVKFGPVLPEPTHHANTLTNNHPTCDTVTLNWRPGDGDGRILVARQGAPVNALPTDLLTYAAHPNFGSGANLGNGNFVMYNGADSTAQVWGLTPNVTYYFAVFEYKGSGPTTSYLTTPGWATDSLTNPLLQADFAFLSDCMSDTIWFQDSSSVTAGSITNWSWNIPTVGTSNLANPAFVVPVGGPYLVSLTVTSNLGCTDTDTLNLNQTSSPLGLALTPTDVACAGAGTGTVSTQLTNGAAPFSYLWSNNGTTANLSGLSGGTYAVTVTDDNGCTVSDSALVAEPLPMLLALNPLAVTCAGANDGAVAMQLVNGMAPFSYQWNNGDTIRNISGLAGGSYAVTVTDSNGCTVMDSVVVNEPLALLATLTATGDTAGAGTGTARVTASGGTPPYGYLWSNGGTTDSISGLLAGSYTVTVTDSNGCTWTDSVNVPLIVGLAEELAQGLRIVPNPSSGTFQLRLDLSVAQDVSVSVYAVDGKLVRRIAPVQTASFRTAIDLTGESAGLYFLHLQVGEQQVRRKLLLVK